MTFRERGIKCFLESLVGKRFSLEDLTNYIMVNKGVDDYLYDLVEQDMEGICDTIDYSLVGCLRNRKDYDMCDFTIYYAKTRSGEMYITEVGYEFS